MLTWDTVVRRFDEVCWTWDGNDSCTIIMGSGNRPRLYKKKKYDDDDEAIAISLLFS